MNISVMQPYFFPYVGYWDLICRSDLFIVLDDVNFITRGWVNRNRFNIDGHNSWFTIPLEKASQNRAISAHRVVAGSAWKAKHLALMRQALGRQPFSDEAYALYDAAVDTRERMLSTLLVNTIRHCCKRLGFSTPVRIASEIVPKGALGGQQRILALCKALNATTYVNLSGGSALYDSAAFEDAGIALEFLDYDPSLGGLIADAYVEPPASLLEIVAVYGLARTRELFVAEA